MKHVLKFCLFMILCSHAYSHDDCVENVDLNGPSVVFQKIGKIGEFDIEIGHPNAKAASGYREFKVWVRSTRLDSQSNSIVKSPTTSAPQDLGCINIHSNSFRIDKQRLIITETTHDRYTPDSEVTTTNYKMDTKGIFTKATSKKVNPFSDLKLEFSNAIKRGDLSKLLETRNRILKAWSSAYDANYFFEERRRLCLDALRVATKNSTPGAIDPFLADPALDSNSHGCEAVHSAYRDMAACAYNEEFCAPLATNDVAILYDAAFRLQKTGNAKAALRLLKVVLHERPMHTAAYTNLASAYLDLKDQKLALLAGILADGVKKTRVALSAPQIESLKATFSFKCPNGKPTGAIVKNGRTPRIRIACGEDKASLLEWDPGLDRPVFAADLEKPSVCPLSKAKPGSLPRKWSDDLSFEMNRRFESCAKIKGAIPLGGCNWMIACGGGIDTDPNNELTIGDSIIDFIAFNEINETISVIARSSAMRIDILPIGEGIQVVEKVEFQAQDSQRVASIGIWSFTCNDENGTACKTKYECNKLPAINFDSYSFQEIGEDWQQFEGNSDLYAFLSSKPSKRPPTGALYPHFDGTNSPPSLALDFNAIYKNRQACY